MIIRKNQAALTAQEWADLIDAINRMHGTSAASPAYRDFVSVHVRAMSMSTESMQWAVHSMGRMMPGTNFLAWHRQFLFQFEARLRQVHPNIALPYWDPIANPTLPAALSKPSLLKSWSVRRKWKPSMLPTLADQNALAGFSSFTSFQSALEATVHADVHNAIGGNMAGASSPSDPIFFLHHANIDRLWDAWQTGHPGKNPPNGTDNLQPLPLFGVTVSSVVSTAALGYKYQ